jgi:hypothetical protein
LTPKPGAAPEIRLQGPSHAGDACSAAVRVPPTVLLCALFGPTPSLAIEMFWPLAAWVVPSALTPK